MNSGYDEYDQPIPAEGATAEEHAAPVLVFKAGNYEEAEVVRATLEAAGIEAMLQADPRNWMLGALNPAQADTGNLAVYVKPSQFEAARAILTAPPPSDEELAEEAEQQG